MGVNGGASLVPQRHRESCGFLELSLEAAAFFCPGTFGSIHIFGAAQYQLLHMILFDQGTELGDDIFRRLGVYCSGITCQQSGGI